MHEALTSAAGYLRQLSEVEDDDPIEVKPILLQRLESAAQSAKKEMSGERENTVHSVATSTAQMFHHADAPVRRYRRTDQNVEY